MTRRGLSMTFSSDSEKMDRSAILSLNADLANIFTSIQNLQTRRKEITGSTAGNVALQNLLTALDDLGIIKDSTT